MIPRATYRLQFRKDFPFAAAEPLAPYLAALGISHVYASPIAAARAGSAHGYDVIDPTRINPELGGEDGFRRLVDALRREGVGIILDIVPNHMAVGGSDNRWWLDVLEKGEASPHAGLFDIDWDGPDPALRGKVLAPFLGAPYGEALSRGDIRLARDAGGALAAVAYGVHRFPIRREDYGEVEHEGLASYDPTGAEARARLHALLERQHWRLADWRTAADEINWRRFFDITGLAGVRVERPEAFELVHALPLRLYAEGLVDGLRVDHVDGLADPAGYGRALRERLDALRPDDRAYLVVEKILAPGEPLAPDWGVDGTTGYDFMNEVSLLQHDPAGADALGAHWRAVSGRPADFEPEARAARLEILARTFGGQLAAAVRAFHRLARASPETRDITAGALSRALSALAAVFPAYRTYATADGLPEWNRPILDRALDLARPLQAPGEGPVPDQIAAWLESDGEAARRWQQLTAPVAAKAVEDTAFYRYGRLISRNDVGFDPKRLGASPADIHAAFEERARRFPHALLATATHDHKRGEDVRARLAVFSELPGLWTERSRRWADLNRPLGDGVDPGDEAMLYQTLVGAWPLDLAPDRPAALAQFRDRLWGWQEKALREAKLRSSWAAPDAEYEARCRRFLHAVMDPGRSSAFLGDVFEVVRLIAPAGALNGLVQALLRCTAPGVPDLYQGAELWDFSLVDPDNRRPVDYAARTAALKPAAAGPGRSLAEAVEAWRDGRVKQAVIACALAARRAAPNIFRQGEHLRLEARGPRAGSVFAFARRSADGCVLVAAAVRCAEGVLGAPTPVPRAGWWRDTRLLTPPGLVAAGWKDRLTERSFEPGAIPCADLFAGLPASLLLNL